MTHLDGDHLSSFSAFVEKYMCMKICEKFSALLHTATKEVVARSRSLPYAIHYRLAVIFLFEQVWSVETGDDDKLLNTLSWIAKVGWSYR